MNVKELLAKVSMRKATADDHAAVLGIIPDLYGGVFSHNLLQAGDHMEGVYHAMLEDPRRFCFVAVLDGEIVGFKVHFVVDDGTTVIRQAGKIKLSLQGMGISNKMLEYSLPNLIKTYPHLQSASVCTGNEAEMYKALSDPRVIHLSYREKGRIKLESKSLIKKAVSSDTFKLSWDSLPMKGTRILAPSKALAVLDSLIDNGHILSEHAWLVNYEPLKACHSNHMTITHHNTRGNTVVMATDASDVRALSFGSSTHLKIGLEYRLDFYCYDQDRNRETGLQFLKAHIFRHLVLLNQRQAERMLILDVVIPKEMDPQMLIDCYNTAGLTGYIALEKKRAYFMEKSINFSLIKGKL